MVRGLQEVLESKSAWRRAVSESIAPGQSYLGFKLGTVMWFWCYVCIVAKYLSMWLVVFKKPQVSRRLIHKQLSCVRELFNWTYAAAFWYCCIFVLLSWAWHAFWLLRFYELNHLDQYFAIMNAWHWNPIILLRLCSQMFNFLKGIGETKTCFGRV